MAKNAYIGTSGVLLNDIPFVRLPEYDTTALPYAFEWDMTDEGVSNLYLYEALDKLPIYSDGKMIFKAPFKRYSWLLYKKNQEEGEPIDDTFVDRSKDTDDTSFDEFDLIRWSNFDFSDDKGNVIFTKSDPVFFNDTARKVKSCFIGIDGVARKIKKAYVGDENGVARMFYQNAIPLADLPVGSSVFMNMDGAPAEFLVVHQGNPDSSIYDASCDGTWLLKKTVYGEDIQFGANMEDFRTSNVRLELNDTIIFAFDQEIQNAIKYVKIPYQHGAGTTGVIHTGADGLQSKLFLLSAYEIGFTTADGNIPVEGVVLDYFKDDKSKRIAYYDDGEQAAWWMRSPHTQYHQKAWSVYDGNLWSENGTTLCSVRPALILPKTTPVDDKFNIIVG